MEQREPASDAGPVLVTGAAGFIGSHVSQALLRRGREVVGLDNFDPFYDLNLKRGNIAEVERAAQQAGASFGLVQADICDRSAIAALFERYRFGSVVHLAARAGVRPSIADPQGYARTNVEGTTVMLQAASEHACRSFVAASSSSVYGNNPKAPFCESDNVDHPISPYAASKKACELIGHTFHHLSKMPVAMLRFFTVFGPRQRPDLAIAQFLGKVGRGEAIRMFGDGTTSRDYTYIDDIVEGVLSALDRAPAHGYRVWNLGGDRPTSLREMIQTVERVTGRSAIVEPAPMQAGDVERTWADLTRAQAELGFTPRTRLEDGVRAQWEWTRRTGGG